MVKDEAYQEALERISEANQSNAFNLSLGGLGLTEIPDTIAQLSNLQILELHNNQLTKVPEVITQLSNLQVLDLENNQLTELPKTFAQLFNLKKLYLEDNYLTEISDVFTQLSNLQELYLNNNRLTKIPENFAQLFNLQALHLENNQLTEIPENFAQLFNLQALHLENNQLKTLPRNLSELKKLNRLCLKGNSLPIPEEIIRKGWGLTIHHQGDPQIIIDYYFDYIVQGEEPLNEAKVILVGQGTVGKTSLVKRLCSEDFNSDECKTDGIAISNLDIDITFGDWELQNIRLNIWDFGGQEIMHATHQFFLTKRSLYLLVLSNRSTEEENRLEYWLKTIESFGSDSPIIVVGNKSDEHPRDLNEKDLRKKYPNIKAFVSTSCKENIGIKHLLNLIKREISKLPHVNDVLPKPWFKIKEHLENLKRNYIPYDEYATICTANNVIDCYRQKVLVSLLHDLGIILNFHDDPNVSDTNVINPEWLTSGIYRIINYSELTTKYQGILSYSLLAEILPQSDYPTHKHKFIIAMMKKFELCLELDDETVLIPNLLPKSAPESLDETEWDNSLRFEYHYPILAQSIISRFIVKMHDFIKNKTWWRTGVVLKDGNNEALVKADLHDKKIFIAVNGTLQTRRDFLAKIRAFFDTINKSFSEKSQPSEEIPLPENPKVVVSYQHLLKLERHGYSQHFPEGADEPISVSELLSSIKPISLGRELTDSLAQTVHIHGDMKVDMPQIELSGSMGVGIVNDGQITDNAKVSGQVNAEGQSETTES